MEDLDYLKNQDTFIAGTDEVGRGPLAARSLDVVFFSLMLQKKKSIG